MTAFLIADTFTDSLARLTGDEQKAVKATTFDLQTDSSAPVVALPGPSGPRTDDLAANLMKVPRAGDAQ